METGVITTFGLLYEGSTFRKWKEQVVKLVYHREYVDNLNEWTWDLPDEEWEEPLSPEEVLQVGAIILGQVSLSVLRRSPGLGVRPRVDDLWNLMRHFRKIAKLFRFAYLPAEMRNRVYGLAMPSSGYRRIFRSPRPTYFGRMDRYPVLLSTSSQLRREALPMFYANTRFDLVFNSVHKDPSRLEDAMNGFRHWIRDLVKDNLKYLRKVVVTEISCLGTSLDFSNDQGLAISSFGGWESSPTMEAKKTKYVHDLNDACKLAGVESQSIGIALTSSSTLWGCEHTAS